MTVWQALILAATKIETSGGSNSTSVAISGDTKNISLSNTLTTVYLWAGMIAVAIVVVAGFFYTLSQDDPQRLARAKNTLLGGVIGLVVIFTAYTITVIVLGAIQ